MHQIWSQPSKLVLCCLENQGFEQIWAGFLPYIWQHGLKINLLKKQIEFVFFLNCDIKKKSLKKAAMTLQPLVETPIFSLLLSYPIKQLLCVYKLALRVTYKRRLIHKFLDRQFCGNITFLA